MALLACLQAFTLQTAMAYSKYNRLVDYRDRVTVYDSNEPTKSVYSIDLMSFPYMTNFESNNTETGMICWAKSWAVYTEECYDKVASKWILINEFDKNFTNEMIDKIRNVTDPAANAVVGLIFETNSVMTSESLYSRPPIMSEATPGDCNTLKPYAYNKLEDPTDQSYKTKYQHFFVANCGVLDAIVPTYFVYTAMWLVTAGVAAAYLYFIIPSESRLSLQKSLLLLPALKALEVFLQGIWLNYCPWVGMDNSAY
mmetsp:Transcript_15026/g.20405  ORF Transcript_15026/g.20405 Transcript_15026/m.20405 type:complete len:255 (+) Transcript_15026:39-803(+)